jgi:zinc protease
MNVPQAAAPRLARLAAALVLISFAVSATAETNSRYQIAHERYALDNGLEVILHQDLRLPSVAVNLWYHVGAAHEPAGSSGFAHLFEHLMFEGSKYAGRNFDPLLESVGGTNMNATTSWDRTNYFETVPAQHLELALWLEADRMGFMIDTLTQERLDVQRDVVKNERRQSYENAPYGKSWLALYELLFPEGHPYRGAVIGSMQDLSAASLNDASDFFARYYAPGNATLCLAGNFDVSRARGYIARYFGTLPARGGRVPAAKGVPPARGSGERLIVRETIELEQVLWAWALPPGYGADHPALELGMRVLTSGKASRLYQLLVSSGLANWVNGSVDANELATIVTIDVGVATGKSVEQVEQVLSAELASLGQTGPSDAELRRARAGFELGLSSELQLLNSSGGDGGRAGQLQRMNHYFGDPGALPRWVALHRAVTPPDIARVTSAALAPGSRATVITKPLGGPDATP